MDGVEHDWLDQGRTVDNDRRSPSTTGTVTVATGSSHVKWDEQDGALAGLFLVEVKVEEAVALHETPTPWGVLPMVGQAMLSCCRPPPATRKFTPCQSCTADS